MNLPANPEDLHPEAPAAAHHASEELAEIVARAVAPSDRINPQREYPGVA